MNLCLDQGNSSIKIGVFEGDNLIHNFSVETLNEAVVQSIFSKFDIRNCILSSVISENEMQNRTLKKLSNKFIELSHLTSIPIQNQYKTPETLGKDRLAAVVGASYLMPSQNILVIDSGTAITYDFVDSNNVYWGGSIAPGLNMRLRAMHEFTSRLPLIEMQEDCPFLGYNTNTALLSGALNGVVFEIDGYIQELKNKYSSLSAFLTGGNIFYFDNKLKNAIFAEKNLVLIGLNRILQYNV